MNQAIEDYLAGLFTSAQIVPAPEVFTGTSSDVRTPVPCDHIAKTLGAQPLWHPSSVLRRPISLFLVA